MQIQYHTLCPRANVPPLIVVCPGFDPLRSVRRLFASPLPPLMATDFRDAIRTQLSNDEVRRVHQVIGRDNNVRSLRPGSGWDGSAGKRLEVFDRLMRRIIQKPADNLEPFVVTYARGGLRRRRPIGEVLEIGALAGIECRADRGQHLHD